MSARLIKFCDSIAGEVPFPTAVPSLPVERENASTLMVDTDREGTGFRVTGALCPPRVLEGDKALPGEYRGTAELREMFSGVGIVRETHDRDEG